VLLINGTNIGSVTTELTGNDAAGHVRDTQIKLTEGGKLVSIHEVDHYDKDGITELKTAEVVADGHTTKSSAVLNKEGAKLTVWTDDTKSEKEVPLATGANQADLSNFWFSKVQPEIGATATFQSFHMDKNEWVEETRKYIGRTTVKVGDKQISAYQVEHKEGNRVSTQYFDEKGELLVETDNELRIERQL
jgi:hypothetical protein